MAHDPTRCHVEAAWFALAGKGRLLLACSAGCRSLRLPDCCAPASRPSPSREVHVPRQLLTDTELQRIYARSRGPVALVAGGLFIAPVNALRAQALQDALPSQQRGEGFSIQYGANGLGTAAGAAITVGLANTSPKLALTINLTIPLLAVTATALTTRYRRRGGRPV